MHTFRKMIFLSKFLLYSSVLTCILGNKSSLYTLVIVHINDLHARFEPTDVNGGQCNVADCIGGYARVVHTVRQLQAQHRQDNVLYLNAGDNYHGSIWYNVGRWLITSVLLNLLPADAMVLGNHEFDHGIPGLWPFLVLLKTPVVISNVDAHKEKQLDGLFSKSLLLRKGDRLVGILGIVLHNVNAIANTGNLIFQNESQALAEQAKQLRQAGADIIILISHCGYGMDQRLARENAADVDVIVGGHTHSFLYTGAHVPMQQQPVGPYPTEIVESKSGKRVLIVQTAGQAKFVGHLELQFDAHNRLAAFKGAPIFMSTQVPQDAAVLKVMQPWKQLMHSIGDKVVGASKVDLLQAPCGRSECLLGNFFSDAIVHAYKFANERHDRGLVLALVHSGGMRVPIPRGNITFGQLLNMAPFENKFVALDLPGAQLMAAFEYSADALDAGPLNNGFPHNFLQVSGMRVTYNSSRPRGQRVQSLQLRCAASGEPPKYAPLQMHKSYRIAMPNFLASGGDGFSMFSLYGANKTAGVTDLEGLIAYTRVSSPIDMALEQRIVVV